jgi:AbrB family looped-hinge helix DNA binding protein
MKRDPDLRVFGLVTIGEKGQIVIPASARRELNLGAGDEVIVIGSPQKKFIGVMRENDFREMLGEMQRHLEQGMAMGRHFTKFREQLDELKK